MASDRSIAYSQQIGCSLTWRSSLGVFGIVSISHHVSVVIPTKNAGPLFVEVLSAIRSQEDVEIDLLVVDSGSSDETLAIAQAHGARVLEIPPQEFNHGATRDRGIGMARHEIVVLMTQDATAGDPFLLANLAKTFDDPAVGGAYARQVARPDADCLTRRNLELAFTGRLVSEVKSLSAEQTFATLSPFERYALCNFDNVCSAVRRSAWLSIPFGKVDFAEDIVWSRRALMAGWKLAYVADSHVVHSHDRPLRYLYRRTYLTHRKLHEEYELTTVPTLRYAFYAIYCTIRADWHHAQHHEPSRRRRYPLMLQIPLLACASVFGQYFGVRDESLGRGRSYAGI